MGDDTRLFLNTCSHQGSLGRGVGEPLPERATQSREDTSFPRLWCRAQELHIPQCGLSLAALPTPGSPSENAPAKPGAQMSAASF